MRTADEIFHDFSSLRDECIINIKEMIKSTNKRALFLEEPTSIAYFGWDGLEKQYLKTLALDENNFLFAENRDGQELEIYDINIGEWWFILEKVADQIKSQQ